MMSTSRRRVLYAVSTSSVSFALAGCVNSLRDNESHGTKSEKSNKTKQMNKDSDPERTEIQYDDEPSYQKCTFEATLIDTPPSHIELVSLAEVDKNALSPLEDIFEAARDPDTEYNKSTKKSGEYESFSIDVGSEKEFNTIKSVLVKKPSNIDRDYPDGVYFTDEDTILAITTVCLT